MATMVKEKRREKKKVKEKINVTEEEPLKLPINISEPLFEEARISVSTTVELGSKSESSTHEIFTEINVTDVTITNESSSEKSDKCDLAINQNMLLDYPKTPPPNSLPLSLPNKNNLEQVLHTEESNKSHLELVSNDCSNIETITDNYEYLNRRLERIAIPVATGPLSEERELELSNSNAYLISSKPTQEMAADSNTAASKSMPKSEAVFENVLPSAPIFEEVLPQQMLYQQEVMLGTRQKLQCMPIEEAIKMFGGKEIEEVKLMSEREEAIVEAGPTNSPDHPLVDLLSTFRSSLRAVENERSKLTRAFSDEERSRSTLWKVQKLNIYQKKECKCTTTVELRAMYEHAELLTERLPVARLRLEGLLRDIQDSYCHHQHAALLAHCQIDEFVSEISQSNKKEIREALFLILQALRMSDGAVALSAALRRWAAALAAALIDERDVSQLLFLLHHLFRQTRSVRWAARVFSPRVNDTVSAARAIALLDILLASPRLEAAVECTEEESEDAWEEVTARGTGGAVSEGALREIDLVALLNVFPLRELVARILQFTQADITQARQHEYTTAADGRVLRACSGVRTLIRTLVRAVRAHTSYHSLSDRLREVATAALNALAHLSHCDRAPYHHDMEESVRVELEACFSETFALLGTTDIHRVNTAVLSDQPAKDYCFTFIIGLHENSPKQIESLGITCPVLPCGTRVRIVTHAAVLRPRDHELARIVLDFLFQTGGKIKSTSCKAGCVTEARQSLSTLLATHPYLRTVALHTVADLAQVESIDASVVDSLQVQEWRPQSDELQAVLHDWAQRCPALLKQLLLLLDYTPHTGISLQSQLTLGTWLCSRFRSHPTWVEHCWRVLLRMRTHGACWMAYQDVPSPEESTDVFSMAYAVLATSWGHCIPLICSSGVNALCALTSRPREAVHCLAPVMLVMAHSPESVSLTPKFVELLTGLLSSGPTIVQRALGLGGTSGQELLLRLALSQIEDPRIPRASILSAWLHALWRVPSPAAGCVLDTVTMAAKEWPTMDAHAHLLLQEDNAKEHVKNAVRNVVTAPLLCECLLRAYHTLREANTGMFAAVANILWEQRVNGKRIHVDNALQKVKATVRSEEMAIYLCGEAALYAPMEHPAHLMVFRLLLHLYLQRPTSNMRETAMPVGPLFYSGLIKTRTLSQIKKRLQDTATYHHNEAEIYKTNDTSTQINRVVKSESITIEKGLLPELSIKDFTGESSDSSECDDSDEGDGKVEAGQRDTSDDEKMHAVNLACYHTAAERMVREFSTWLDEGDRVRASPHHADIARYIPEQALEAAWKHTLTRTRPSPSPELDDFPRPVPPPNTPPEREKTPLELAMDDLMKIKDKSGVRSRRLIRSQLEDVDFKDSRTLLAIVDKHLKDIDQLAKEWSSEVSRIHSLDSNLWELTVALRVPRPLPPVTKQCPNAKHAGCKPLVFYIDEREWCISTGAERGIKENRSSWRAAVRRVSRARPHAARTSAALHAIARRLRDSGSAVCVVQRAWRNAAYCAPCTAAEYALSSLLEEISDRWISRDGRLVADLISGWCSKPTNALQQALCGSLISPRRMNMEDWPLVYTALLNAKLPSHTIFSYLSRFEIAHWSQTAPPTLRHDLLDTLITAQTRFGPSPGSEHSILLELMGVHTTALMSVQELCGTVVQVSRLGDRMPAGQWTHVVKAVGLLGEGVGFDQLGHLLRDLGALWWEKRSQYKGAPVLVPYAEYVAKLLRALLRYFVAAAVKLSYEPDRVGRCAWSAVQESWGAWVAPHPTIPPLLPSLASEEGHYTNMLVAFVDCLREVMDECPGSATSLLQQVFEWGALSHRAVQAGGQEGRVQGSELLVQLTTLPWDHHQWFYGACLQLAVQMFATNDMEIMSWTADTCRGTQCATLLRDVTPASVASRLAPLLYLLTATKLYRPHISEQATHLPWSELPEDALAEALDRFFAVHHNPAQAYHDLPQFQLILYASELRLQPDSRSGSNARAKRGRFISQWCMSSGAPSLHEHVATYTHCLLQTLTDLAPFLEQSSGELEELLGRASVIMCMEPAAASALPVWQKWVRTTNCRMTSACVSCACALTAVHYSASLCDVTVRAYLAHNDSSWIEVFQRWQMSSPWREPQAFVTRSCLHAAYVCANVCGGDSSSAIAALRTTEVDFVENEAIIAVWICYACRIARSGVASVGEECIATVRSLLSAWAQPPRRSILRVVTLQKDNDRSTTSHRLLCRLAECILSPSSDASQAYETACTSTGHTDVIPWGRDTSPDHLPRLAARLYPNYHRYFECELEATKRSF